MANGEAPLVPNGQLDIQNSEEAALAGEENTFWYLHQRDTTPEGLDEQWSELRAQLGLAGSDEERDAIVFTALEFTWWGDLPTKVSGLHERWEVDMAWDGKPEPTVLQNILRGRANRGLRGDNKLFTPLAELQERFDFSTAYAKAAAAVQTDVAFVDSQRERLGSSRVSTVAENKLWRALEAVGEADQLHDHTAAVTAVSELDAPGIAEVMMRIMRDGAVSSDYSQGLQQYAKWYPGIRQYLETVRAADGNVPAQSYEDRRQTLNLEEVLRNFGRLGSHITNHLSYYMAFAAVAGNRAATLKIMNDKELNGRFCDAAWYFLEAAAQDSLAGQEAS